MVKHICKILILFIPSFITILQLTFCLLSDLWITINYIKLEKVKNLYQEDYNVYMNDTNSNLLSPNNYVNLNQNIIVKNNKNQEMLPTILPKTSTNGYNPNINNNNNNNDNNNNNLVTKNKGNNLDHEELESINIEDEIEKETHNNIFNKSNIDNTNEDDKINDDDYDTDSLYDENIKKVKRQIKESSIDTNYDYQFDESSTVSSLRLKNNKKIDYVYVTKLWPLIVSKSLYSECVYYEKLNLKLSIAYLTSKNKEPITGTIHYNNALLKNSIESNDNPETCNGKVGMTKCILSDICVNGYQCDGITDCDDQSDEQFCAKKICKTHHGGFMCDDRCWHNWNKCDLIPHCFNLTDEFSSDCPIKSFQTSNFFRQFQKSANYAHTLINQPFSFGYDHYIKKSNCFKRYFNFKSAIIIKNESLKYLSQLLANNIQETNNINYHLQLIYSLAFLASFGFCLLALISLMFITCFSKLCLQCPFWFFGFFQMLSWLASFFGITTFLYQWFSNKQRSLDPSTRLPIENEILRLNSELLMLEELSLSFWIAVGASFSSCIASFLSCIVCCRLPSNRHEDKEYKIMHLPNFS